MLRTKKKFGIIPAVTLILISVVLSGCSKNSEPEIVKNGSANQASQTLNNNNISANPTNNPAPVISNASTTNVNKKPLPPVKELTPQIGSGGSDMSLFAQARTALSSDEKLMNSVIIEIKEGNATLSGNVPGEALKTKAEKLVQGVTGIKSVKNNLRVSP